MKRNIIKTLALGALTLASFATASAQNTTTAYFLDYYNYRYQMNPAFGNVKGFVAFPALGNFNLSVGGSLGVKDVIYNVNGKTTTFLNPGVSTSEFLGNIGDKNRFGLSLNIPVIAFGFKGCGGYNTVTLSTKADINAKIPGSLFRMLKEGVTNSTYDIGNVDARAVGYAELAFGHSHQINEELRVGATVKFIAAGARVDLDMEHADLQLGTDSWRIVSEGSLEANVKGLTYDTDYNETTHNHYVSGADVDNPGPNGFGLGVDLGVVYTPVFMKELTLTASIIDLGFIKWNNNMLASTNGRREFSTDKYTFNVDDDAPNNFSDELDKMGDDLSALYELSDMGDQGSKTTGLGATFTIGGEYKLPMYNKLKFGLLNTTRLNGEYTWTDFRLSAVWQAGKMFDAAVSVGTGTFGAEFGWVANLHIPGINLFAGMDRMFSSVAKGVAVPLSSSAAFNMGLNFTF